LRFHARPASGCGGNSTTCTPGPAIDAAADGYATTGGEDRSGPDLPQTFVCFHFHFPDERDAEAFALAFGLPYDPRQKKILFPPFPSPMVRAGRPREVVAADPPTRTGAKIFPSRSAF
jgi:hypothetical protein